MPLTGCDAALRLLRAGEAVERRIVVGRSEQIGLASEDRRRSHRRHRSSDSLQKHLHGGLLDQERGDRCGESR